MYKNSFIFVGLLLLILVFSGCIDTNNSIYGTYSNIRTIQHPGNYIEQINESIVIYKDNTFLFKDIEKNYGYSGVVKQQGDEYIFTAPLLSFSGKIVNDTLTIDDGSIFIKQR